MGYNDAGMLYEFDGIAPPAAKLPISDMFNGKFLVPSDNKFFVG